MRKNTYLDFVKNESFYYIFIVGIIYFFSYVTVRGKQSYYHIPSELTTMDISVLLNGGLIVAPILVVLLAILGANYFFEETDPSTQWIKRFMIIIIVYRLIIEPSNNLLGSYIFLFVSLSILLEGLLPFFSPLFISKNKRLRLHPRLWRLVLIDAKRKKRINKPANFPPTYKKVIKYDPIINFHIMKYLYCLRRLQRRTKWFINKYYHQDLRKVFKITIILFFLSIFCSNIGAFMAKNEETYRFVKLPDQKSLFVVLGTYKDSLITAPVNFKKKEITPVFKLVKIKSNDSKTFYTQKVGHLKVKETKIPKQYY